MDVNREYLERKTMWVTGHCGSSFTEVLAIGAVSVVKYME